MTDFFWNGNSKDWESNRGQTPQGILVMNKEIKEEVREFKEMMAKYSLAWNREDIAAPAHYDEMPADQKEFVMLRAAERWTEYHQTLCEHGEKDFADRYFPTGASGGPAMSRLQQIGYYLKMQEEKPAPEATSSTWWDRTKSAVRNIFDLENER